MSLAGGGGGGGGGAAGLGGWHPSASAAIFLASASLAIPSAVRQAQYVSTPFLARSLAFAIFSGQYFAPADFSALAIAASVSINWSGTVTLLSWAPKCDPAHPRIKMNMTGYLPSYPFSFLL
jgi:hypothetical protein